MHAQSAILPPSSRFARFLLIRRHSNLSVPAIIAALRELAVTRVRLQGQHPEAGLISAVAFGGALWRELNGHAPEGWHELAPLQGKFSMPAVPADIFLHIRSDSFDLCYELAQLFMAKLTAQGGVDVLEECAGFRYLDSRDLTGFIDGSENPQTQEERAETALLAEGEFAGGSFVFAQRYVHHLDKWHRLTVDAQEHVIGRSKLESIELDDDVMPPNSHVARNVIEEDGEELAILRHSLPYGNAGSEHGLFFVAYTNDLSILDRMLANMFGTSGDDQSDRLLNFTTPVGGAYFFAPSEEMLVTIVGED